ncbi:hypothetical protein [Flavobacterium aurantiibacter]|uniref:Lipoprotein n=1 Tax=Flavobacterium aurantiibacter TaxID=2023067 RepID=A0A255ZAV5_9FLAO|nr:hypothetical protein [Flavobacterium aurantiibacter]OYQ38618.1 hypothetical protein CHX27_14620 [Flavobacterium aurantiibacter]
MYKEQKQLLNLLSNLFLLSLVVISCKSEYSGNLKIIYAYYTENSGCPAFIKQEGRTLTIEKTYKYKDGKLTEFQACASEGLYTKFFEKDNHYTNEDLLVKDLSLKKVNGDVILFNKVYPILRINSDTIFAEITKNKDYLIITGNIPN